MYKNIMNKFHRPLPEYYDSMYMDGYTPEEISYAARRSILRRYYERKMAKDDVMDIRIKSEVKVK